MIKGSVKLMIVDDHEIVRLGLNRALQQNPDFEIIAEASNGRDAVLRAQALSPHVVLMDIRMPQMDGIEATRQIKATTKDVRVLILTSNDNHTDMLACFSAGADGYCVKTTPSKSLSHAVETIHAGSLWLDPYIARMALTAHILPPEKTTEKGQISEKVKTSTGLSEREMQILTLVVEGLTNQEIAVKLFVSPDTVKTHMTHILSKLAVSDRTQAAVKALREGLVN